jgi:hypothetical protein
MARPKKKTTALAKASEPPPQQQGLGLQLPPGVRLPGVAVQTNPLIAVIACLRQEHVDDLGHEIEATENYLQGLKAVHSVVRQVFPPAAPVEVVAAEPAKPEPDATLNGKNVYIEKEPEEEAPPRQPGRPEKPATKEAGTWKGGRPKDPESPSGIALRMLRADINTKADPIIAEIKRLTSSTASIATLRSMISTKRWYVKNEGTKTDGPPPVAEPNTEEVDDAGVDGEDDELELRKEVAEFLFKRGLATNAEIMNKCGIPSSRISDFMRHEWFEYETRTQQWRLTSKGKQDGLDY